MTTPARRAQLRKDVAFQAEHVANFSVFAPELVEILDDFVALEQHVKVLETALWELAAVPAAGPFPNKGACAAFAQYIQSTASTALMNGRP